MNADTHKPFEMAPIVRLPLRRLVRAAVVPLLILAVACGPGVVPTATPAPSPAVLSSPTATRVPPTATAVPTATSTPRPTAPPTPSPPAFVPTRCKFGVPQGITVECGYIRVPEDRQGDPTDTIRLEIAIYRSKNPDPALPPVVYLQGGPGVRTLLWSVDAYGQFGEPVIARRDLVLFDQRGTGLSDPALDCRELVMLNLQNLMQSFPAAERQERFLAAMQECRDRLTSRGANLAAYTSAESAADLADIITALGYEQVDLYGISYGSRLALEVMRDFPELVRSVVLDSVVPIHVSVYSHQGSYYDQALQALFDDCAADRQCAASYPNLGTVFSQLVERLDASPASVTVTSPVDGRTYPVQVDGTGLTNVVLWGLHFSMVSYLPEVIYTTWEGDYSVLGLLLVLPAQGYGYSSTGMMISVNCHEQIFTTTPEELETLVDPDPELVGLPTVFTPDALFAACEMWGAAPLDPRDREPLVSDIPTLILAGRYDPTTPPALGRMVAETLSHGYYFEFPSVGHAPTSSVPEHCALNMALAFFDDPSRAPDSSCIAATSGVWFRTPGSR